MSAIDESKPQRSRFVFVYAGDLDGVTDDPEEGSKERKSWLDQLEAPIGDELLVALRQAFTITYRQDYAEGAAERMLAEIRKLATDALRPCDAILRALRHKPLGADPPERHGAKVFKFVVASVRDLSRKVTVEDTKEKARFIDVVESAPADGALIALRKIVSLTFSEVFTKKDRRRLLWEIRHLAAEALVPLNAQLEDIEYEPVAMPTRPFLADEDAEELDQEGPA